MKKIIIGIVAILNITGCSTIDRMMNQSNPKNVLYVNWNDKIAPEFISVEYQKKYNTLNCLTQGEDAKQERNKQLERFLIGVDSYFYKKKNALITGKGLNNTMADMVQLGLTGAASFAGGGTPNLLAAIATALNGSKLSFDKNVFSDQSSLLIAAKMEQLRLSKLNDIQRKKTEDCTKYSLDAAMKDGIEYYYSGSINGALVAIFNETGQKMIEEQKEEEEIIKKNYESSQDEKKLLRKEKEILLKEKEQSIGLSTN